MDTAVLANDLSISSDQLSCGVRKRFPLLRQVGVEKVLVVASGNKTYLLRVGLFGKCQTVAARKISHFRLRHSTEGEQRTAELFLGQAEQKISLILGPIGWTL